MTIENARQIVLTYACSLLTSSTAGDNGSVGLINLHRTDCVFFLYMGIDLAVAHASPGQPTHQLCDHGITIHVLSGVLDAVPDAIHVAPNSNHHAGLSVRTPDRFCLQDGLYAHTI